MSAWSVLPNAVHIDRILESLKTHPDIWTADFDTARVDRLAAFDMARDLLRDADWREAWFASWQTAQDETWFAARDEAWQTALNAAWDVARPSIVALIAWDDSAQFLEMNGDALEVWMRISGDPRAILLLPAVRAFERIKTLETL